MRAGSVSILIYIAVSLVFGVSVGHAEEDKYIEVSEYLYLGGNLYEKHQQLYFITERVIMNEDGRPWYQPVYLKRFYFYDEDKNQLDPLLSEIIDRGTWQPISKFFYRDKNNLYCFSPSSGGGYLNYLEGKNPDSLKFIASGESEVPKVDGERYSFNGDYIRKDLGLISWYTSIGKDVFYRCRKLGSADLNSFRLISDERSKWTAEDNSFYHAGGKQTKKIKM